MTNFSRRSLFGCHVAVGDVAPGFCVRYVSGGEVSLLTSARRHLCAFMDPGLVHVCFGAFTVVWVVVFITGRLSSFVGGRVCFRPSQWPGGCGSLVP